MSFLDRIRQTIARYNLLHAGENLGVAVSGGADSVCLLHVLLALRAEFGLRLAIVHVDHNLRGAESQADAQFVHTLAQQLGLPFHLRTLELDLGRGNLEQESRRARYGFFRDLIRAGAIQKVAVGHTRSDQAETVLYRLLRGAGSAGLAGIRPVTESGVVRPLLQVTRPEVEVWLRERAIPWRQDATNAELRFDRNRIRHQLIPGLEAEWNPGLQETLAQTADWAWEEERYWRPQIRQMTRQLHPDWVRSEKNAVVIDAATLNSLPIAVVRRLVREIVQRVKDDLLGISFAHIESIRELAADPRGAGRRQIAGVEVFRSFNWLRFARTGEAPGAVGNWQFCVTAPGRYSIPCRATELSALVCPPEVEADPARGGDHPPNLAAGRREYGVPPAGIELELVCNSGVYNGSLNALDGERVCGSLVLRNWRAGDRYRRQGHAGAKKVKRLFEEYRIPLWERRNWPIITVGGQVVWASQFGPAAEFAVNAESRTVLMIRETRETSDEV